MICEFLEDAYPCYFPKLLPEDPYDKAFARIWIDFVGKAFLPSFFRLLQSQEKVKQDEARADLYKAIEQITAKRKGPYFFGQEFSLVDIAIAPWAIRDYILSEHRGYKREDLGKSWVDWVGLALRRIPKDRLIGCQYIPDSQEYRPNLHHTGPALDTLVECEGGYCPLSYRS